MVDLHGFHFSRYQECFLLTSPVIQCWSVYTLTPCHLYLITQQLHWLGKSVFHCCSSLPLYPKRYHGGNGQLNGLKQRMPFPRAKGFPCGNMVKNPPANAGDPGSIPGFRRSPGKGTCNPLQSVFLLGQRSLASYSPRGCKKSDTHAHMLYQRLLL